MDLFTPASEPELLQPATGCIEDDPVEMRNRSPTLNGEQKKLADSLFRKSRELVKNSRCFNNIQQHENIQSNEHTRSRDH
jgi:hypothetical protein